jgi:hypothetical protein
MVLITGLFGSPMAKLEPEPNRKRRAQCRTGADMLCVKERRLTDIISSVADKLGSVRRKNLRVWEPRLGCDKRMAIVREAATGRSWLLVLARREFSRDHSSDKGTL